MKKNLIWPLLLTWQFSSIAFTCDEIKTRHPFVLIHGLLGFAGEMPFGLSYWGDIPEFLQEKGAIILLGDLSATNDTTVRGEQLYQQLKQWGYDKYHLIGHSQGGLDARFILEKDPELVASVTTIGTPHRGSPVADVCYATIEAMPVISKIIWRIFDVAGCCIGVVSHHYYDVKNEAREISLQIHQLSAGMLENVNVRCLLNTAMNCLSRTKIVDACDKAKKAVPIIFTGVRKVCGRLWHGISEIYCQLQKQDAKKAIKCLTTKALEEFNSVYSQGVVSEHCDKKLFSCGTHGVQRNGNWDLVGASMQLMSWLFFGAKKNDGVVDLTSMQFGKWLGEFCGPHHFVVANNGLGSFRQEDINWFRNMLLTLAEYLGEDHL